MHSLVDSAKAACAEFLEKGILASWVAAGNGIGLEDMLCIGRLWGRRG